MRRYAGGLGLVEMMLAEGRLLDFVLEMERAMDEERLWQLYLERVYDRSYEEFQNQYAQPQGFAPEQLETTIMESQNILKHMGERRKSDGAV